MANNVEVGDQGSQAWAGGGIIACESTPHLLHEHILNVWGIRDGVCFWPTSLETDAYVFDSCVVRWMIKEQTP